MKTSILFILILLQTGFCFAQDIPQSDVPSLVLNTFKQQFPKADDIEWERKGDQYYVEFDIGFADHEVWFDATGKIVKHKEEIKSSELPETVKATIKRDFAGYRIDDAEKTDVNGTVTYKVELKTLLNEWKVILDANGKVLDKTED